ncbi:MAG: ABC transporter substrate-binding protein [Clostridiales bacterium]|nr:ABC transporter substrate-binding protein [Clostridiales bacterium]
MKKRIKRTLPVFLLCLALTAVLLSGCGSAEQSSAEQSSQAETVIFTDSLGREVELPADIERYAVTGPLAQIVCFALDPDEMVALASDWSAEAALYIDEDYYNLPVLGQLYGGSGDLNREELAKADPQVIIDVGETKTDLEDDLEGIEEQTGIPAIHIAMDTASTPEAFRMLGELFDMQEEAEELASYCEQKYSEMEDIMEQVGDDRKTVLYCLGDLGCNVICKDSYHSEVIDLLSDNLAVVDTPSSKGTGNEVDFEQILKWNPEVIFFAPQSVYSVVGEDSLWQELDAIQNGNYYEVPYGPYNWMGFPPSVQRYLGMMWMAKILYPEYATYDLEEEVIRYYELFYHCELTEEQYLDLVGNSIITSVD